MKPIDDWRQAGRLWSLRICAAAAALFTALAVFTEQLHQLWQQLPPAVQAMIPGHDKIALALFVAVAIARLVQQRSPKA
ncbi:hypothetical protein GCM10011380_08950 [Sphingomonas metalli]|uniref:Uncharacterized protein n=1 Tax=Sphingomonas metalli TaxID=1779358 RepID=A0A916WPY8_9SPHN|nr:hypothetical protein [Sphingomonas metalli]GGB21574.1 hypothetical protein GCM10011380_08950 [Sphingomonas metalli]